jgi:Tetratricopeptide repeat
MNLTARRHLVAAAAALAVVGIGVSGPALAAGASPASTNKADCTSTTAQRLIDEGSYDAAIRAFTCVISDQPTAVDGYRGRAEAELLLGRYSDAMRDYARVTAVVVPVHPDATATIFAGYDARLAAAPNDVAALTGASFARWWNFQYPTALQLLDHLLLVEPNNAYGILYRGSNRMLLGANRPSGAADLERAISMAPDSPDVRFIVADAYTYGAPDPERAIAEASRALAWGLDTPRVHAILATSLLALGDVNTSASHFKRHLDLVTTELVSAAALGVRESVRLDLRAGRTYEIPVPATAGDPIHVRTSSPTQEILDSIAVLLAPDGSPIIGSDDAQRYYAGFDYVAEQTGTYRVRVTSFEGVGTGELLVSRS